jgi:hypothetical protein
MTKQIKVYDEGKKIFSACEKDRKKLKKKFDDFFDQKYN